MLPIPKKINKNRVLYYIQSEKVRGLQLDVDFASARGDYIQSEKVRGLQHPARIQQVYAIISNRKKSEACNSFDTTRATENIISNRKKSEACNSVCSERHKSPIISNRKKSEACNSLRLVCAVLIDYIQSEKVRGLQQHYASTNSTPINRLFRHFSPPKTKPLA